MKKTFKAVLSVFCAVTLLASLIIPSLVLPASAYTFAENQDSIVYTFENDLSIDVVDGKDTAGGAYDISDGALEVKAQADRCVAFNNGQQWLTLDQGTYVIEFKYRYNQDQFEKTVGGETSVTRGTIIPLVKNSYDAGKPNYGAVYASGFLTFEQSKIGQALTGYALVKIPQNGTYVGFRGATNTYCYIDEITIAKKTSIEIIPTDGTSSAVAEVISGVPGAAATLPDASILDGAIADKVFEGFYADAAFTTPITAAMNFPTDALTTTIYAKMVADNAVPEGTIIFDFDNNNAGMKTGNSNTVENITVSGGAYGISVNKPAEAQGNVLSVNGTVGSSAHNHGDTRDIIFNDGTAFTALSAGDYEITYDYFVKYIALSNMASNCTTCKNFFNGTKSQQINFATFKKDGFGATSAKNVCGASSDGIIAANVVSAENPTASGSGKVTLTVTEQMVTDGTNYFGIRISKLSHSVWLDNITVKPVANKPAKTVTMDFETDTASDTGTEMLKIVDSTGKDGNPSKVFLASSNDQIRTQLVKDKDDNPYSLTKGVWKMTYDYKVPTDHNQKLWLLHNVMITKGQLTSGGATTDYTSGKKLSQENLAKVTTGGDTWLSDSIIINVTAEEGVSYIGFGAETGSSSNAVYIDNVVFTEVTDSVVNVSFNTNGGNDIESVQGFIGEKITVADPVKNGFDFVGWYEDAACTIPSNMEFKVGVTTLYAAWTEAGTGLVFDFDTKNKNFAAGGNWSGGMYTIQDDPKGESGKTLGLNALTANDNHGDPRDILFNDGANAITLEAGTYKINYKYYAIYRENGFFGNQAVKGECSMCNKFDAIYADPSVIKVRFGVLGNFAKTSNNTKAAVTGNIFDMGLITPTYESRWTDGWAVLEVTQAMVDAGTNKLVLSSVNLPFTIYLDDIKINKIDTTTPVTLHFDSKGGTSVSSITTQSYTVVSYPTPTKAGYNFAGWVDSYGNPAPQYAPTVNTTYYATWEEAGKYAFIDMDNGFFSGNTSYGSGYFTKNTTKFKDDPAHKNTLRFLNTNGASITRIHLLSSEGKFAQVSPGKIYKVTFDYYVEQLPDGNDIQFDFTVNHNNADNWLYNPTKAKRLTGGNILDGLTNKSTDLVGKWMTKEMAVVIPTDITDSRLGILSVNGTGAIVHFDNIKFESIEGNTVLLTYVIPATGQTAFIIGDRGTKIDKSKIPVLNSEKLEFTGWFSDEACTKPFSADVFPSKSMTIYGGTQLNTKGVHINFEDYPWKGDTSSNRISLSVMDAVNDGISYDGDGWALKFDNTKDTKTTSSKKLLLNLEGSTFPLQDGATYIITYHYYLVNPVSLGTIRVGFGAGANGNMWGNVNSFVPVTSFNAVNMTVGKWYTGYATGKVEAVSAGRTFLQATLGVPIDSVVYFDDFKVQQVRDGYSSLVFSSDYGTAPDPMIVKTGSTVTLPKLTGMPASKQLIGWIVGDTNVGLGKYTVNESAILKAGIVTTKFTESFENWNSAYDIDGQGFDGDYAIYDSKAQGNSADNVKSGRYSLHRLGKEPGIKGYSLFMNSDIAGNEMVFGNTYTVSMWVKVKDPVHTTGGIEIRNNDTFRHAWGTSADTMKVVAIADIADGQWHKISYTFVAMARYISIFTPGNLEIFIDDVTITYAPGTAVSLNAIYEDYVPNFLTEDGKYVKPETEFALNDFELFKRTETVTPGESHSQIVELITQNMGATIAIIAGAVVLLAGAAVVIIVLIKKRKAKEVK